MKTKHIFRIDDVCENMNWENFLKIKDIFVKYDIKPIIGVIPANTDEMLKEYPPCKFDFWEEIKHLQQVLGWSIALHGYNHKYLTKSSGILGINNRSEFAGLSREEQYDKIKRGKEVFQEHNIRIDAFMAPAHSFDYVTVKCLLENGIDVITDGFGYYPYKKKGMVFVPQLYSNPRPQRIKGIYTWCLHTNSISIESIENIEKFAQENSESIISFSDAHQYIVNTPQNFIGRLFSQLFINSGRKIKAMLMSRRVNG